MLPGKAVLFFFFPTSVFLNCIQDDLKWYRIGIVQILVYGGKPMISWLFEKVNQWWSGLKENSKYSWSGGGVQSLSCVWLFATPWTSTCQASLPFALSWSLLKLMSIESVTPSNHLILCHPLLLLPSIFPSIRVCVGWCEDGKNTQDD